MNKDTNISIKTSWVGELRLRFYDLFIRDRFEHRRVWEKNSVSWTMVHGEKFRPEDIEHHASILPLGLVPRAYNDFLVLDFDIHDKDANKAAEQRKIRHCIESLSLEFGTPGLAFLSSESGGVHWWLFFTERVDVADLKHLHDFITDRAAAFDVKVEFRPHLTDQGKHGKSSLRLPLAVGGAFLGKDFKPIYGAEGMAAAINAYEQIMTGLQLLDVAQYVTPARGHIPQDEMTEIWREMFSDLDPEPIAPPTDPERAARFGVVGVVPSKGRAGHRTAFLEEFYRNGAKPGQSNEIISQLAAHHVFYRANETPEDAVAAVMNDVEQHHNGNIRSYLKSPKDFQRRVEFYVGIFFSKREGKAGTGWTQRVTAADLERIANLCGAGEEKFAAFLFHLFDTVRTKQARGTLTTYTGRTHQGKPSFRLSLRFIMNWKGFSNKNTAHRFRQLAEDRGVITRTKGKRNGQWYVLNAPLEAGETVEYTDHQAALRMRAQSDVENIREVLRELKQRYGGAMVAEYFGISERHLRRVLRGERSVSKTLKNAVLSFQDGGVIHRGADQT